MNQDILLSKIVPNATETTWSQAYTTLNVYIALSIESAKTTNTVASIGKDVLEKLQREFFALDQKDLENIKEAVENVAKTIEPEYEYSILVGAIVKDILYIVIASQGIVILKRGDRVGVIAQGKKDELVGFSGRLEHDDIVSFETGGFNEKIPLSTMQEYLSVNDVSQISENITPLVHGESKGNEAAIILQYKDIDKSVIPSEEGEEFVQQEEVEEPEVDHEENVKEDEVTSNLWTKPPKENFENDGPIEELEESTHPKNSFIPSFPSLKSLRSITSFFSPKNKKGIIVVVAIFLIILLIGSIVFETNRRNSAARQEEFAKVYTPAKSTFDEGVELESLNKSLALEKLLDSQKLIEGSISKFPESSQEYKDLAALLKDIQSKIESIGGGGQIKNQKVITKSSDELPSIDAVTIKGGQLAVVSEKGKKIATLRPTGGIDESFETETSGSLITADEKFIYILGDGVERIDKGNGSKETVLEKVKGSAIELFGSNFYVLNGDDIEKYRAPSENSTSYFAEKPTFEANPISFSIDGSVWILEDNGEIVKFTKGKREAYEIKGLLAPFSTNSQIYTDVDYSNLYILDVKNQRVVALSKKGEYQNQYEWNEFENATSFAIDEKNKKGYVVVNDALNSFDL